MSVAITGVGACLAGGFGRAGLAGLLEGGCDDRLVGRPRGTQYSRRFDRFQSMDTYSRLAFVAADHALAEAGWFGEERNRYDMGIAMGTRFGCHEANQRYDRFSFTDEGVLKNASPLAFKVTVDNAPGGWLSVVHGLHGPNITLVSGRGASAEAIAEGLRCLERGHAPAMLVGGVERATPLMLEAEDVAVPSEGAGVLILEPEGPGWCALVDVALAGEMSLDALLEKYGIDESSIGWLIGDPAAPQPHSIGSLKCDQSLGRATGDLHGAWASIAACVAAGFPDEWPGEGRFALIQAITDDPKRTHWVLLERSEVWGQVDPRL